MAAKKLAVAAWRERSPRWDQDDSIRLPDESKATLAPIAVTHIQRESPSNSDEATIYKATATAGPYAHMLVNHSIEESVAGIHYVNGIEGFWGHFKKGIKGTNVGMPKKHMRKYVAEYQYRRNHRDIGTFGMLN